MSNNSDTTKAVMVASLVGGAAGALAGTMMLKMVPEATTEEAKTPRSIEAKTKVKPPKLAASQAPVVGGVLELVAGAEPSSFRLVTTRSMPVLIWSSA